MKEFFLRTEGLKKSFKGKVVVSELNFCLKKGQVVGLLGPNGAGKTTSFHMLLGLLKPDAGKIFLGDKDITAVSIHMRSLLGMGYLPQEFSIFRRLSAYDNIYAVLEARGLDSRECRKRTEQFLGEFSLNRIAQSLGEELSGGERRRVEIARSLALSPHFLLLDEPFAGIDPIAIEEIQSIIRFLKDKNVGILITDHNVRETLKICEEAYIIISGKIEHAGTPKEIAQNSKVRDTYLGKDFHL